MALLAKDYVGHLIENRFWNRGAIILIGESGSLGLAFMSGFFCWRGNMEGGNGCTTSVSNIALYSFLAFKLFEIYDASITPFFINRRLDQVGTKSEVTLAPAVTQEGSGAFAPALALRISF